MTDVLSRLVRFFLVSIPVAACVLAVLPFAAATLPADDPAEPVETGYAEQIVVTATGNATPADRVGSTITVVTREDLERKQIRSVPDALREVPGVDVRRNGALGSTASIFIRGADSDHTLLLVDGIEVNDPSSPNRTAFIDHLTVDEIDRIEVLRGPQSTLYGSDAIGGVVNIITNRGSGKPKHGAWTEGGRYSTFRGGLRSAGEVGRMTYAIGGSFTNSDGFSASSSGTERDPYRNGSIAGSLGFEATDRFGVDVVVRHTEAEVDFDGFFSEPNHSVDAVQSMIGVGTHLDSRGGRWRQRWDVRGTRHDRDTSGDFPSIVHGELLGMAWRNDVDLTGQHTLTVGLEGDWETGEFAAVEDSARTLGLLVQDQFDVGKRMFGTLGLRVDDHDTFGSEATYRVAFGYRFRSTGTTLRGSHGTGFKAPSLAELNPLLFAGSADLKPETSRGFDAGVEQQWMNGKVTAGATLFLNRIDDLIYALCDDFFNCLYENVEEVRTRGVETFAGYAPEHGVRLRGTYTLTDTEAEGGEILVAGSKLPRRPEHKGSLDAHYEFAGPRIGVTLGALYVGDRDDIDPATFATVEADEYWLANLAASWDVLAGLQVFGRVDNLFDEAYEDVLGFGTAGRAAYAGIRVDIGRVSSSGTRKR